MPKAATRRQEATPASDANQIEAVIEALAVAEQRNERLIRLVSDLAGRLFCYECQIGTRSSGSLRGGTIRHVGGTSPATYEVVREKVVEFLRDGVGGDDVA
jgi:hypothetical protein